MFSKKRLKRLQDTLKRDTEFGIPNHKSKKHNPTRDAFISYLMESEDFVPTVAKNHKKTKFPFKSILKQFNAFDWILIGGLALTGGVFANKTVQKHEPVQKIEVQKQNVNAAIIVAMCVILSAAVGFGAIFGIHNSKSETAVDDMYNRLSVRLFDSLREIYPDLDENMLKACNPEMARVIKALLVTNMSKSDVDKIHKKALILSEILMDLTTKNNMGTLTRYNNKIKDIVSIIEHNMIRVPGLTESVLWVFRGSVPLKFNLLSEQKTK